ncbi:MAG: TonB-dependent siderophore receptor [Terracidiphilus sp.]|nr:TonB-dependent siderophore receptor [Terracidiphilus sp.]
MYSKSVLRIASTALAIALAVPLHAQSSPAQAQPQSSAPAPAAPQTKVAPVTTTVIVRGETHDDYLPDSLATGTLDSLPLNSAPLSATVVTRELLTDQAARVLSDVIKNDASIGEDYAPVGYYGDFQIRGIPIDLATGLQINGLTVAGEQDVPLENKQSVEFLKGLAGVESGVASAGGLIGYVTKRPALVTALDASTDHRGTAFGGIDLGRFFGSRKQVGARLNLAGEHMMSYVQHADGWRGVGAGAADWHINPATVFTSDFEYQHKVERSVCGYQLLGGDTVPDINRLYRSHMLGYQSWQKPNTFDTWNASARLTRDLPRNWRAQFAASLSHSLIDDNVVYAYGNSINDPYYFFAPDGTYDIYDYRNPGELRIDGVAEALATGRVKTGALTHELSAGAELFLRNVRQSGNAPANAPDYVVDGSIYAWVGEENIYQTDQSYPAATSPSGHPLQAGPRALYEDNHQSSLLLQDRVRIPGGFQLIAAGRYDSLRDHNFSGSLNTDKNLWLPQFAATYNPIAAVTIYGNYGVLLSLGPQAPWWVSNGSEYLAPFFTRQAEAGIKIAPTQRLLVTAAWFRMTTPNFYPRILAKADTTCPTAAAGDQCFESDGREIHNGVELNAEGKATRWLRLTGSLTAMNATGEHTSTASYNGKQIVNQPHLRTAFFADLALPYAHGLHLMPGWSYTGVKQAMRDDSVSVPAYNLFNLGARYTPGCDSGKVSFRLYADNIANKRYWKDTGANYGDLFLHLGAPTTVRLSAHYTF